MSGLVEHTYGGPQFVIEGNSQHCFGFAVCVACFIWFGQGNGFHCDGA
jgi:hypothetical protein